jgi:hypothetical protein
VQCEVQLGLHQWFGDVQVGRNSVRRPPQVLGASNHFSIQRLQPIQGVTDQRAIDGVVGLAPVTITVGDHDVNVTFPTK